MKKQPQQNFVESFSAVGVLKIILMPPVQVPLNLKNFTELTSKYEFGKPPANLTKNDYQEFEQYEKLALLISNFVSLEVKSKARDDPGIPNHDISNFWLLNFTKSALTIQVNFTDPKLISELTVVPDKLLIKFPDFP